MFILFLMRINSMGSLIEPKFLFVFLMCVCVKESRKLKKLGKLFSGNVIDIVDIIKMRTL